MHQNVTGKNVRISKNVRAHIASKMQNIKVQADRIIDANIICEHIREEYTVEGTVTLGKIVFHAKEKAKDLYVAIDAMFQKIERDIVKMKDKQVDKSQRVVKDKSVSAIEENETSYNIITTGIYEKPLEELDAVGHFKMEKKPYFAYLPIKQGEDLYSIKIGHYPVFLFREDNGVYSEISFQEDLDVPKGKYLSQSGDWWSEELIVAEDDNVNTGKRELYDIKEFNVSEAVSYLMENNNKRYVVYVSSITDQAEALYKESANSFVLIRMFDI